MKPYIMTVKLDNCSLQKHISKSFIHYNNYYNVLNNNKYSLDSVINETEGKKNNFFGNSLHDNKCKTKVYYF